jgi:WD40 repeat protein
MQDQWVPLLTGDFPIAVGPDPRHGSAVSGLVAFFLNNTEPIKLTIYALPFVVLFLFYRSLYITAATERDRAETNRRNLAIRTSAAYFNEALRNIDNDRFTEALAYLGSALHSNPQNYAAEFRLISLLNEHNFWMPATKPMRHRRSIEEAHFSPDEKRLITGASDWKARIWDTVTGEPLFLLEHSNEIFSSVFTRNGGKAVTFDRESRGHIWDSGTGRELRDIARDKPQYEEGFLSRDGNVLVTLDREKDQQVIELFDVEDGKKIFRTELDQQMFPRNTRSDHTSATRVAWNQDSLSADNSKILVSTVPNEFDFKRGYLALWDIRTGKQLWGPVGVDDLSKATLTPNGDQVIAICSNGSLQLRDGATGQTRQELRTTGTPPKAARLSPNGKTLVLTNEEYLKTARLRDGKWESDWSEMHPVPVIPNYLGTASSLEMIQPPDVVFSDDSSMLIATPYDTVYETEKGSECGRLSNRDANELRCAEFSPSGKKLVTGSRSGIARVWNCSTRPNTDETVLISDEKIMYFRASKTGNRVATVSHSGTITILDTESLKTIISYPLKLDPENYYLVNFEFSPSGNCLAVVFEPDKQANAMSVPEFLRDPRAHTNSILLITERTGQSPIVKQGPSLLTDGPSLVAVAWNANGSKLAAVSGNSVIVYNTVTGESSILNCGAEEPPFLSAEFNSDDNIYVFDTQGVRVWNCSNRTSATRFIASETGFGVLSPNRAIIATVPYGDGAPISLWNTQDGKPLGKPIVPWSGDWSSTTFLAFGSDSKRLIASSSVFSGFQIFDLTTRKSIVNKFNTEPLSSGAVFVQDGQVIMGSGGQVRFWSNDGKKLAAGIEMGGEYAQAAAISADAHRLFFINDKNQLVTRPLSVEFSKVPEWLPDLAEAICGWRVNDAGILESIEDIQPQRIEEVFSRIRSCNDGSHLKNWAMTNIVR